MRISIKKKWVYVGIALVALLIIGAFFYAKWIIDKGDYLTPDGLMKLPQRENVRYNEFPYENNSNYTITKIVYESAGADIYGFLLEPKDRGEVPGVVLLPGAGVDKVGEIPVAKIIASLGYAVLVIDQRGTGETKGGLPRLEEDFANFRKGVVARWHLPIIDALVAADVLSTRKGVDPNRIILVGESMGGRVAMIAAAIDVRMKGVIAISSAGFHYKEGDDVQKDRFLRSLDADFYVAKISPRNFIMIHSVWDKTIPAQSASVTFDLASDPKLFILMNNTECGHGYCDAMLRPLNFSLALVSGS